MNNTCCYEIICLRVCKLRAYVFVKLFVTSHSFTSKYLRPAVCTVFLRSLLFLLPPSHERTSTEPVDKDDVSSNLGAEGRTRT